MTKSNNETKSDPISLYTLLKANKFKGKHQILGGIESNQFKFPNFIAVNEETDDLDVLLENIKSKPNIPLDIDKTDALSPESISNLINSMNVLTFSNPIMDSITTHQRIIILTALTEACRIGMHLGFAADALKLSEKRSTDEDFKASVKAYPKAHARAIGERKNNKVRTMAKQFLYETLKDTPSISINKLALILEADSKNNPDKYGKTIPLSSCTRYARSIKNAQFNSI